MLTLVDRREYGFGRRRGRADVVVARELVDMFLDVDQLRDLGAPHRRSPEQLTDDDVLAAGGIRRRLAERGDRLPEWLARLGEAEVYRAQEMVHILGDGDNVHVAVRFAGGAELTAVVYIDHNMGTLVKDAFVVPESLAELEVFMRTKVDDPDTVWRAISTWPTPGSGSPKRSNWRRGPCHRSRPTPGRCAARSSSGSLGRCPRAGSATCGREWNERDQQQLADRFFDSPFGAPLDDADHRGLLESVIWFGTDYGPGDPLRWSPVAVEIIMVDWIPRKLVADTAYLSKAPDLLRAFVRFCHADRKIRTELTRDTLAAVDLYEPEYQRTIRSSRPQGPMALLAAMGAIDPDGRWEMDVVDPDGGPGFDFGDHRRVHPRAATRGGRRR